MMPILRRICFALLLLCAATPAFAQAQFTAISAAGSAATFDSIDRGAVGIQITGSFTGTIAFESTINNSTWVPIDATPAIGSTPVTSATAPGMWFISTAGTIKVRAITAAGLSGTASIYITAAAAAPSKGGAGASFTGEITGPLGQQVMADSMSVVIASDYPGFSVNPSTSGGLSISRFVSAASTNATNLKASAGQLYWLAYFSLDATPVYLHLFNTAGTPTCNASIIATIPLVSNSTATNGALALIPIPYGLAFATGIGYCVTTGLDGTGSVSANEVVITFGFK